MSLTLTVTVKDETPRVKAEVKKATITSLSHAAAYVRKVAISLIRRSKISSLPGQPPRTRRGVLKRGIRYAVEEGRQEAVIGPTRSAVGGIAHTHEFGGTEPPKKPKGRRSRFRLEEGGFGPIKVENGKLIVVRLNTPRQVARAEEVAATIPPSKGGPPSTKPRHYPPRRFMGPALLRSKNRLSRFWVRAVRGG